MSKRSRGSLKSQDELAIQNNYVYLLEELHASSICPYLFQACIFNKHDKEEIDICGTRKEKAEKLIEKLLHAGPDDAYEVFLRALEKEQNHIAVQLKQSASARAAKESPCKTVDEIQAKDEVIRTKDEVIRTKEEEIKAQDEEIQAKAEEIKAKDELIRTKDEELKAKDNEIKELKQKRGKTIDEMTALEIALKAKEEEIKAKNEALKAKDDEIKAKDDEIKANEKAMKAKLQALKAKDDEIKAEDNVLKANDDQMKAKDIEINVKGDERKAKDEEIKEKGSEVFSLRNKSDTATDSKTVQDQSHSGVATKDKSGKKIDNTEVNCAEEKKCINLVLVGKTGNGKSATGNSILNRACFKTDGACESATKEEEYEMVEYKNNQIQVVDCPGVGDIHYIDEVVKATELLVDKMRDAVLLNSDGCNVFLLVIKYGNRLTAEDKYCVSILKAIFGPDVLMHYCILVVTNGDCFKKETKTTFENWCKERKGIFNELLFECDMRVVLFDNISKDKAVRKEQMNKLLDLIDKLQHRERRYTKKHFLFATRNREQLTADIQKLVIEKSLKNICIIL